MKVIFAVAAGVTTVLTGCGGGSTATTAAPTKAATAAPTTAAPTTAAPTTAAPTTAAPPSFPEPLPIKLGGVLPEGTQQYFRHMNYTLMDEEASECAFNHTSEVDLGKKLDPKCCDPATYKSGLLTTEGKDERTKAAGGFPDAEDADKKWTCYLRPRAKQPGVTEDTYVRSYFGCEDGKIYSGESCVGGIPNNPPTKKPLYPLPKGAALPYYQLGTTAEDSCKCKRFGPGPGCFVATSTKMIMPSSTSLVANLIKIEGSCPAPTTASEFSLV